MNQETRVLILASGNGSNAEALMRKAQTLHNIKVVGVVTNNPKARVIQRASDLKVPSHIVENEEEILRIAKSQQANWILLAGYMKILSKKFIQSFGQSCIVNIHPSLLPMYPGLKSIERAHQDQVEFSGVTLHYVDEGMDTGKIIRQEKVKCRGLSFAEFESATHKLEHQMYTDFLESLSQGVAE